MKSKYELSISMNYVPNWTYIEAMRELYQNAIDNEIENPDNKMLLRREGDRVIICNKTSKLEMDSLLIGKSTKSDDNRTIGTHGEGYKLAIVILLREGKSVTIYNYGKREIWTTKMVKSRRYAGATIPVVTVEKEAIWKAVPDNDLTIEVSGITDEEYEQMKVKNLNIRDKALNNITVFERGRILTDDFEAGNIYVKGLFVCHNDKFLLGYDFEPDVIRLDRDRRLIDSFNLSWEASNLWARVVNCENSTDSHIDMAAQLIRAKALDVAYISSSVAFQGTGSAGLIDKVTKSFFDENGENAFPVDNNIDYAAAQSAGYSPIIVDKRDMNFYRASDKIKSMAERMKNSVMKGVTSEKLEFILNNIEDKLSNEWIEHIKNVISEIKTMEEKISHM